MSVEPLVLNRHFKAPPERLFAAFTERALMQGWYGPAGMTVPHCEVDARVGGAYRIEMHGAEGNVSIVTGVFREIEPPRRLVFTWGWLNGAGRNPETVVCLTFTPRAGGTDLELVQTGFAKEEFRLGHNEGWVSALDGLDPALAGAPKPTRAGPMLLGHPQSSYTRAARIAFEEKGVAYEFQPSAPHSPELLDIHPWGRAPGLRLGARKLYETSAILRYVEEAYPGPALMPADPFERARVEQWISAFNAYLDRAFVRDYVLVYILSGGKPDRAGIESALPTLRQGLAILEQGYEGRQYLVGEAPSLADILICPALAGLGRLPESAAMLADCPSVRRAQAAMAARPSFAATQPQ
ncbi:MAG TPA: SRPBCC domain-containing protein [Roseiarcus sp.]|nr:SRPBCC domain-containing protein [Roseiarcus sp.]